MKRSKGYTVNPRGLWEDTIFADEKFSEREAYLYIRDKASFKDNLYRTKNKLIPIKRGQHACTIVGLADRFQWSRTKIRHFLNLLEKSGKIVQQKDSNVTIITICDYDLNQDDETPEGQQPLQHQDISETAARHTINKVKKGKKQTDGADAPESHPQENRFMEVWQIYKPTKGRNGKTRRKGDRSEAETEYKKLLKKGRTHEEIMRGTRRYVEECWGDGTFTKDGERFLRDLCEQYIDDPPENENPEDINQQFFSQLKIPK